MNFLKTGGAGDVDFGNVAADDVQPDEQQTSRSQALADGLGSGAIGVIERLRFAPAPGGQVAAHFAALRNAGQAPGHGLAVNDEHALVAGLDGGQVLLRHDGDGAAVIEGFDDGAEVQAVSRHAEDAHAAHAVQRFEDDVAVFGVKGADGFGRSRDERGRDVLRPLHDGELFGVVAQGARAVDDARALALGLLQQVRGVDVFGVKRRVLAHQNGVKRRQRLHAFARDVVPDAGFIARQPQRLHAGRDACAALPLQMARLAKGDAVAARGGFAHHGEGAVLVRFEGVQRIGDEEQLHGTSLSGGRGPLFY